MRPLEGKVAILSGSGRGIGREAALRIAAEGASVVINDLDEEPANETVAMITAAGGHAIAVVGDVTAPDFGTRFVAAAVEDLGRLDIIVNNAGYTRDGWIQNQSDRQFQAMLDVHVTAPFRILRAAGEYWRGACPAGTGTAMRKVVNVSSIAGTQGNAGQVNYSAAKAAMVGMTKTLAKEWGRLRICVNCVAFGFIDTRLTAARGEDASRIVINGETIQAGVPATMRDMLDKTVPLGRTGTAREAAGAIYFLCSPDSDYVSGETLTVGGGLNI